MTPTSACRCDELTLLQDVQADDHAEHLVRERTEDGGSVVWFSCPHTGRRWVMEFLGGEGEARSIRLRRSMAAAELVEHLADAEPGEVLEWTHEDIEFILPGDARTYHGLDQARAAAAAAAVDPSTPKRQAVSLIEVSEREALVLGGVSYVRDGVRSEHRPGGWLVTVKHGKISRSLWFDTWDAARRAAGLPEGATGRRIARWAFSVVARYASALTPALVRRPDSSRAVASSGVSSG
jgi:hypothetical protein